MGTTMSLFSQFFPPKAQYSVDQIPDLTGRVIIVTGGNGGIGKEITKALLEHNAKVYIAGRSIQKSETAIQELKDQTGHEALFLQLDLSDLSSVKASAEEFLRQATRLSYNSRPDICTSKEKELHILFNNAGVMASPPDLLTAQDYDLQFGTNVLGHFYFTTLLLPSLLAGTKNSPDGHVRVVNISSVGAYMATSLDFNAFTDSPARRKYAPFDLYGFSKLGNALFSNEMAKRYGDQGIVSTACNPGNLKTDLGRHLGRIAQFLIKPLTYPTPYGALTPLWAGTSPEGSEMNGQFLIPWARRPSTPPKLATDEKLAADVWKWCEEQCAKQQPSS